MQPTEINFCNEPSRLPAPCSPTDSLLSPCLQVDHCNMQNGHGPGLLRQGYSGFSWLRIRIGNTLEGTMGQHQWCLCSVLWMLSIPLVMYSLIHGAPTMQQSLDPVMVRKSNQTDTFSVKCSIY